MSDPTVSQRVLNTPLGENDAHAATVRDYLIALLVQLWREEEGFDGKRPFGNSGWAYEVYGPLVKAGLIEGVVDEYGDVDLDVRAADALIIDAIKSLPVPPEPLGAPNV
jgi:hypothetical protein